MPPIHLAAVILPCSVGLAAESLALNDHVDVVEAVMRERAGSAFSVFVPLIGEYGLGGVPLDVASALHKRFPTKSTTWVFHVPRETVRKSTTASTSWSTNILWAHADANARFLDEFALGTGMFEFALCPEGIFSLWNTSYLGNFFSFVKQAFMLPRFTGSPAPEAPSDSFLSDIAADRPPWAGKLALSSELHQWGERAATTVVRVRALDRWCHHSVGEMAFATIRIYKLHLNTAEDKVAYLTTWWRIGPRTKSAKSAEKPIRASATVTGSRQPLSKNIPFPRALKSSADRAVFHERLYEKSVPSPPTRLDRLAFLPLPAVRALQPSLKSLRQIRRQMLRLPAFTDCALCNYCLSGDRVQWCDHHAMDPKNILNRTVAKTTKANSGHACLESTFQLYKKRK